jgi:lipoate-protein ligase A
MYSILKARPGRTKKQMVQSVYQKITTITEQIEQANFTPKSLADFIIQDLLENYPHKFSLRELTEEELKLAKKLARERYKSEQWLFLK